jgi:SAM-dependent methyltransferase
MHPRARPPAWNASYLVLRSLAAQLEAQARTRLQSDQLELLDIGCGSRPYKNIFAPYVARSVGLNVTDGPDVDVVGSAESVPFGDESFDCVLCTQVLEHVEHPAAVVSEAHRVLRHGGTAFMSTHGIAPHHPNPNDYWRWTKAGLERLFITAADWADVEIHANGGSATTIVYLTGGELNKVAGKLGLVPLSNAIVLLLNTIAWRLDQVLLRTYPERFADLSANYLVVATRG